MGVIHRLGEDVINRSLNICYTKGESFGYPLSELQSIPPSSLPPELASVLPQGVPLTGGVPFLCPRTTSAIVSSHLYSPGVAQAYASPTGYVIDKALNYGNSGGPIVATETGKVFALCSAFQGVIIPQKHLGAAVVPIMIPSLYGIVSSLSVQSVLDVLKKNGVPISDQ
jgi:serine protease Do